MTTKPDAPATGPATGEVLVPPAHLTDAEIEAIAAALDAEAADHRAHACELRAYARMRR